MKKDIAGNVVDRQLNHNHEPETKNELMRQEVRYAVKKQAAADVYERPRKLIHKELEKLHTDEIDENIPLTKKDWESIRRGVYTARRRVQPKKPRNVDEVHDHIESANVKNLDVLMNDLIVNNMSLYSLRPVTWQCYSKERLLYTLTARSNSLQNPLPNFSQYMDLSRGTIYP